MRLVPPVAYEVLSAAIQQALSEEGNQYRFAVKQPNARTLKIEGDPQDGNKVSTSEVKTYLDSLMEKLRVDLQSNHINVELKEKRGLLTISGKTSEIDRTVKLLRMTAKEFVTEDVVERMRYTGFFRWSDKRNDSNNNNMNATDVVNCLVQ